MAEGVLEPKNPIVGSFAAWLRTRRERPGRRRAAEQRDELPPFHAETRLSVCLGSTCRRVAG
jgi:hypothetical protein